MEIKQLATEIAVFLTPFLPYLVSGGEEMAKEVGKRFGETTWYKAKLLWNKIKNLTEKDPKLNIVTNGLAKDPSDQDYQLILAKSLTSQLEKSPELTAELIALIKDDRAVQKILIEKGSQVNNIYQRLSKTGRQETTIRGSRAGNINQEQ